MPATYTRFLFHLVFSTRDRRPGIRPEWREQLHAYLGGTVNRSGATSLGVGGTSDHVHLLLALPASACFADLVREIKKSSSAWVRETLAEDFAWQSGCGAFTVSASLAGTVQHYIAHQQEHHRRRSFRDELIELLQKSGIEFDLRYLD